MNNPHSDFVATLISIGDELHSALRVHRAIADTLGFFVDVTLSFRMRVEAAVDALRAVTTDDLSAAGLRADSLRRLAILLEYSDADEREALESLLEADKLYRRLSQNGLTDLFGLVVVSYEHGAMLRRTGNLDEAERRLDASSEVLNEAGFRHGVCLFAAERGLARILNGKSAEELLKRAREPSTEFKRELSAVIETEAIAEVSLGNFDRALGLLDEAFEMAQNANYPAGTELDRQLDELRLRRRRAALHELVGQPELSQKELARAVQLVGTIRGGWYSPTSVQNSSGLRLGQRYGSEPSDPFWKPFAQALEAAAIVSSGESKNPELTILALETMRRSALGGFLRYTTSSNLLPPGVLSDSRDEVALREYHDLEVRDISNSLQNSVVSNFALSDAESMRRALEEELSLFFADAYLPECIEPADVRLVVAGSHSVTYQVLDQVADVVSGVWYWLNQTGEADAGTFHVEKMTAILEGIAECEFGDPTESLQLLARALLPAALCQELQASSANVDLYIAPDGPLFGVPWGALLIAGRFFAPDRLCLVERANIRLTPAISYLRPPELHEGSDVLLGLFPSGNLTTDILRQDEEAWAGVPTSKVRSTWTPESFFGELDARKWRVAYLASHGTESGLAQHLVCPTLERLDFFDLVEHRWPNDVVLASCWSGHPQMNLADGFAPLGVSLAPLLRGARTTVGGAHRVHNTATASMMVNLAPLLSIGSLAWCLSEAQRRWLATSRRRDRLPSRWAFLIALTLDSA